MLWLYNLHYFNFLISNKVDKKEKTFENFINNWILHNSLGKGVGWDPYPSSLRIVNWIKWSLSGAKLNQKVILSLATQTKHLEKNIEYHLLGNHIFANAKALVFAGLFFEGNEAKRWYSKGIKIIKNEINEQVLADGSHFELSPMYHSIFIEDILDIINIHKAFNRKHIKCLDELIPRMIEWFDWMSHPDGEVSFFNDSVVGISPNIKRIKNYALKLGFKLNNYSQKFIDFKDSGYSVIRTKSLYLVIDRSKVGPEYLPGHSHADSLSFELSLFERRFIVNSGVSDYSASKKRHYQRGTFNHSTVTIDRQNSSEVWSSFRVGDRARIFNRDTHVENNIIKLNACHDGFRKLKGSPVHCRSWNIFGSYIEIIDYITGSEKHMIEIVYPLHPSIKKVKIIKNETIINFNNKKIKIQIDGKGQIKYQNSFYHPSIGLSEKNFKLIYSYFGDLPEKIVTRISW